MKLLGYEFRKLLTKPVFLLLTLLVSAVLLVRFDGACRSYETVDRMLYQKTRDELAELPYEEALLKISRDRDGLILCRMKELYGETEEGNVFFQEQAFWITERYNQSPDDFLTEYEEYADSPEEREKLQAVFSMLAEQYEYIGEYREFITGLSERAEELQSVSIFAKKNSFSNRSIQKSVKDFSRLGVPGVTPDLEAGVIAVGQDYTSVIFIFVIVTGATVILFSEERDRRMLEMLRSTKRGHAPLACAKSAALWLYAMLTVLLVSGGRIVIAGLRLGFGDLSRPLQSVSYFRDCCFRITVFEYLAFTVLITMAAVTVFSAILSFLFVIFEKPWAGVGIAAAFTGAEYLCYRYISDNFAVNSLKYLNIFSFSDVPSRFSVYSNINLFGRPISIFPTGTVTGVILMAAALTGLLIAFPKDLRLRIRSPFKLKQKIRIRGSVRLFAQESYRLYFLSLGIAGLLLIGYLGSRQIETEEMLFSDADYLYYSWGQEIAGEVTDSIEKWLSDKQEELNREASGIPSNYKELSEEERLQALFQARLRGREIEEKQHVLVRIQEEVTYLETARARGIPVHYISKVQSNPIFTEGKSFLLQGLLVLAILSIFVCPVFAEDEESGMGKLVHTAKHGRGRVFLLRYLGILILWSAAFVIFLIPYFYNWVHVYRMSDWDAPVQSVLRYVFCDGKMTIRQFMVLWLSGSYVSGIGFLSMMSVFSRFLKQKSTTIIVSVAVIAADFFVNLLEFPGFSLAGLSSGFSMTEILKNIGKTGGLYIIFVKNILVSAGILLLHRRTYVR